MSEATSTNEADEAIAQVKPTANELLARALHTLAPGTTYNGKPQGYFVLETGKNLPKNTVSIRKSGPARATFFVEHEEILDSASKAEIWLTAVPNKGKGFNKSKFECFGLSPEIIQAKSAVIRSLLQESMRVIESRQPAVRKSKTGN